MNRFICRILSFVFLFTSCVPASWAQAVKARPDAKRPSWIEKTVQTAVQTAQKVHNFSQAQQELDEAFDYQDIAKKLNTLHQLYNARYQEQQQQRRRQEIEAMSHQYQVHPNDAIPAIPQPIVPQAPKKSEVLELIRADKMTPQALLNFIDPLDPAKADWQESGYAAQALANTLVTTQETYPGLENYLRQAQMRVLYRLSKTDLTGNVSNVEINAVGQLRVTMMALHLCYQQLFGKDPLAEYKSATARTPQQWVSKNSPYLEENQRRALNTLNLFGSATEVNIYEKIRSGFMREIRHWKNDLPNDPYTAAKLIRTLQGRNQTSNFSFGEAAGDIVVNDVLFFIPMIKGLGEWLGITGDDTKTPVARLSAMAPLAVEYDLLEGNFEHVKTVVKALEPQKLAESTFNREAIFKNDGMYQSAQPAVVEIFNTIYVYALTPGRTQTQWLRAMDLLHHFANPYQYSIMTRLAAISTAAKLMDLRYTAANPTPFDEAHGNTEGIEHLKNMILPTQSYLNKMDLSKMGAEDPIGAISNPNYNYQFLTGNKPYAYADIMAQYVVDIYAILKRGHLPGTQDYGLGAKQTKAAEDGLAKLYNIFQRDVSNKERYPQILARGSENVEQRMEYNGKAYKEPVLHTYGARVRTSGGGTVDMYLDNALQSHFDKDAGDFCATLVVDIIVWKFLVGVVRVAGKGVKLAKGLIMPKGSKLVLSSQFASIGGTTARAAKTLRVDQTAFKTGINMADPQAQATLKNAQELANLPIPDAATATRAQVCRFLGIAEDASESTFRKALTKMKAKYHPDHFEKYITPQVQKELSSKAGSLASLEEFANPAGKAAAQAGTTAAQAAKGPKLLTNTAAEEETRWEKAAYAAKARAAQVPQKPVDYNSWENVTKGFAKFFAADYALSYLNLPLEDHMQKIAADDAEKQYKPQTYGNTQAPKKAKPTDGSPTALFDEVSAAADPERGGAILRLPINLGKMALGSDVLGADMRARMAAAMRQQEFNNAATAATVEKFKEQVKQSVKKLPKEKESLLQLNAPLLAAVPTAKAEVERMFAAYQTALEKANNLANTNLQQAKTDAQAALKQLANTRSDILVRCVKAYWPGQDQVLTGNYINSLQQNYGQTSVSAQDQAQIARIYKEYTTQKLNIQTQWFTLLADAQQNAAAMEELNQQTRVLEENTKRALNQIELRIGLDISIANIPSQRINFLWANQDMLTAVPSAHKELVQLYGTYLQGMKRARELVNSDVAQAQNLAQETFTKFTNTKTQIMVNTVQTYWTEMSDKLIVSYTNQLQQQFINQLSVTEMGKLQSLIEAYCKRRQELGVQFWQAVNDPQTAKAVQEQVRLDENKATENLDKQVEALVNRIQRRFDADPWLSFVQALYIEAAKDLNEAFPFETYAYSPAYSQAVKIYNVYLQEIQTALEAIDPNNPDQNAFTAAKTAAQQKRNSAWNELKGRLRWQEASRKSEQEHPAFYQNQAPAYTPSVTVPYRPYDQLDE